MLGHCSGHVLHHMCGWAGVQSQVEVMLYVVLQHMFVGVCCKETDAVAEGVSGVD